MTADPAAAGSSAGTGARGHIRLTSHSGGMDAPPIHWGAATAAERGPVVGTTTNRAHRNVIGTHSGSYGVYRALAVAAGALSREHRADLTNTSPTDTVGPYPQWTDPAAIVSLDPWGAMVADVFAGELAAGLRHPPDHRRHQGARDPARDHRGHRQKGRLHPDGHVLLPGGAALVTKAAIEPVWYLPGVAAALRLQRNRSAPRAVRGDRRHVPRAGHPLRPRGVPAADRRSDRLHLRQRRAIWPTRTIELTARVHDECNGSDVFGSDICTCRPYLTHAIEECIQRRAARRRRAWSSYSRKEGRALGEVTKFLVYNARKRQEGGDTADAVLRPHRMRRRRAGHALPGTDARRAALAGHHARSTGWCR